MPLPPESSYTQERAEYVQAVLADRSLGLSARARQVLRMHHELGQPVTTPDMQRAGLSDPASAIRDLRDKGVAVERSMVRVQGSDGRPQSFAAYWVELPAEGRDTSRLTGRRAFPKAFRDRVYDAHGHVCLLCSAVYSARLLQPDHRVPYRVGGEPDEFRVEDFMPLCGSHNRMKSFECERCPNWEARDEQVCRSCYWAFPEDYQHVATVPDRRLDLAFRGDDIEIFYALREHAQADGMAPEAWLRDRLPQFLNADGEAELPGPS